MLYSLNKVVKNHNPEHLPQPSMIDEPFMLWVNRTIVGANHSKANNCVTGVKSKSTIDSKQSGCL